MKFMLDANVVIALLAGEPERLRERIERCERGDIGISAILYAEVALGSWNGKRPPLTVLDRLPRLFEIMPFDEAAARVYARLPFKRASFDRLIAAHAIATDLTLVTNNERDFGGIPHLIVENWTR